MLPAAIQPALRAAFIQNTTEEAAGQHGARAPTPLLGAPQEQCRQVVLECRKRCQGFLCAGCRRASFAEQPRLAQELLPEKKRVLCPLQLITCSN